MKPKLDDVVKIFTTDGWWEVPGRVLCGGVFALTNRDGVLGMTHIKTGRLVQNSVLTLKAAARANAKLLSLDINWDFDDADEVKKWCNSTKKKIRKIQEELLSK